MTTLPPPRQGLARQQWTEALAPGADCLPLERLDAALTSAEQAHVAGCARCQTELELFAAFEANAPVEAQGLAVPWIAAETKRRLAPAPATVSVPARGAWRLPSWALLAASLAVVAGGATLLMRPTAPAPVTDTAPVYRGAQVTIATAAGDLDAAPASVTWNAVEGAVDYDLRLLEVDGTELWRVASPPQKSVPADARAAFLPGRTLVWRVDARGMPVDSLIVSSGDTRARVRPAGCVWGDDRVTSGLRVTLSTLRGAAASVCLLAVSAGAQTLPMEVRTVDDTAVPGGVLQLKLEVTEPRPIFTGGGWSFDGYDQFLGLAVGGSADSAAVGVMRGAKLKPPHGGAVERPGADRLSDPGHGAEGAVAGPDSRADLRRQHRHLSFHWDPAACRSRRLASRAPSP